MSEQKMVRLRDLGVWSGGNTPSKARADFWNDGVIPWVSPKDMKVHELSGSEDLISETALQEGRVSLLPAGAVLIVTRSGILSHSLPVAVTKVPVTINQDIKALVPYKGVCPRYVAHALRGASQRILKTCSKHGTTVASVETAAFLDFEIPLLPLDEQRKVVAEIEKQLSRLDEAVANLQRVKANLKRYKASVLKTAVEGRLVETEASIAQREGRSYESAQEMIEKTQSPPRPNRFNSRTGDVILGHGALAVGIPPTPVPEGWQWVNLVEIAKMETGHTPSRGHPEWWGGDVPWIGIADARDHHERSILKTIQYTNSDGLANSAARLLPAGTVCVSRTASVGYVVVMGKPMATSQDFVNWIPTSAVISDWLRVIFTADRDALIRFGKGTVHKTIYFPEWLSASIALPPLTEQARIVAEVDRHLSIISEVESEVDANLRRTQALRQATLSNKFSGS